MNEKKLLALTGEDTRPDHNYEPRALNEGISIEMEHTDNPAVAKVIAKTHLDESNSYYQKLKLVGL